MQKYSKINASDKVVDALLALNDIHETLLSLNSGTAFPTSNLYVGMPCLRTDLNKIYVLKTIEPLAWTLIADLNADIYNAETLGGKSPAAFAPAGHVGASGEAHKVVTALLNGFMSTTDKIKLDGIDTGANKYVHPDSHPASMITGLAEVAGGIVSASLTTPNGYIKFANGLILQWGTENVSPDDSVLILPITTPPGTIIYSASLTVPYGYLKANGAAVSRTTYAALFAAIGTTFGAGDGSTTFNLPDLRGEFFRGWDDGRGIDGWRAFGSVQGDAIRDFQWSFGAHNGSEDMGYLNPVDGVPNPIEYVRSNYRMSGDGKGWYQVGVRWRIGAALPVANENRPRNVALLACIKY